MKKAVIFLALVLAWSYSVFSQDSNKGEPDPKAGSFIKLSDHLDDPNRGLCIDIPGHLSNTNIRAPLMVHTCKDGFWNYDERFLQEALEKSGKLLMPKFNLCLATTYVRPGALLKLAECNDESINQSWELVAGQLRLKAHPEYCIEVDARPSEVSIGTRTHPVQHLVRPISLEKCLESGNKYQTWQFSEPSETPGIRYPDGRPGNW